MVGPADKCSCLMWPKQLHSSMNGGWRQLHLKRACRSDSQVVTFKWTWLEWGMSGQGQIYTVGVGRAQWKWGTMLLLQGSLGWGQGRSRGCVDSHIATCTHTCWVGVFKSWWTGEMSGEHRSQLHCRRIWGSGEDRLGWWIHILVMLLAGIGVVVFTVTLEQHLQLCLECAKVSDGLPWIWQITINKYIGFNISNVYWLIGLMSLLDHDISNFELILHLDHGPSEVSTTFHLSIWMLPLMFHTYIPQLCSFKDNCFSPTSVLPIQALLLITDVNPCCAEQHSLSSPLTMLLQACMLESYYEIQAQLLSTFPNYIFELCCLINTINLPSTPTVVLSSQEQLLICCILEPFHNLLPTFFWAVSCRKVPPWPELAREYFSSSSFPYFQNFGNWF